MKKLTSTKIYKILCCLILGIMFVYMCYDANTQSFWVDELGWTINYLANNNFFLMLKELITAGYNLPLYYIIMWPIYHLFPYGQIWLLLPNFIMIIIAIGLLKQVGEKIGGKNFGLVVLCLAATSYILLTQGAFELRPYALLFLTSTFLLYRYILVFDNPSRKNKVLFSLAMILIAYTHWFGCLSIVFYFLYDTYRFLRKKIKLNYLLPYISAGIIFLPWFIAFLKNSTVNISDYWGGSPTFETIINTLKYLANNTSCYLLIIIGIFITILHLLFKHFEKTKYYIICLGNVITVIGIAYIYSKYINPSGSLYVLRYFLVLLPHIFILTSIPLVELLDLEITINKKKIDLEINGFTIGYKLFIIIFIICICILGVDNYNKSHQEQLNYYEPYRQFSDYIINTKKTYDKKTAILTSAGSDYITYYFLKRGYDAPNAVFIGNNDIFKVIIEDQRAIRVPCKSEELLKYDTLYLFATHFSFEKILDFINQNYDVEGYGPLGVTIYSKKILN